LRGAQLRRRFVRSVSGSTTATIRANFNDVTTHEWLDAPPNGLVKNTAQLVTLFALCNLWMARRRLIGVEG
jgi:hypothetical protein